jgi:hypothetical protein
MSFFDLLFFAALLATVTALFLAAFSAIRGSGARAIGILRKACVGLGIYLVIISVASFFSPRRVLHAGDSLCFDDWCVAVHSIEQVPSKTPVSYVATLKLSSSSRTDAQRENDLFVYLIDDRDRRYSPIPDPSATPMSVLLQPQQFLITSRTFETPADVHPVGLVIAHLDPSPMRWFIIGEDSWFHKPTLVPLP